MEENEVKTILLLGNSFPLKRDTPPEKLLIKSDPIEVTETAKLYVSDRGTRIKKDDLLKLRKVQDGLLPLYEMYCHPSDEAMAAEMILRRVAEDAAIAKSYVDSIYAASQAGHEVLDQAERVRRLNAAALARLTRTHNPVA